MTRLRLAAAALVLAAALPALAAKRPLGANEKIDLNRASPAELMRLPGVGAKRAQAIVAHRGKAPFRKPEDVLAVKGLGPSWFGRVRGNVTVTPPAPAAPAAPARGR